MALIRVKATAPGYGGTPPMLRQPGDVFSAEKPGAKDKAPSWWEPVTSKEKVDDTGMTDAEKATVELEKLRKECRDKKVDFPMDAKAPQLRELLGKAE